MEYTLYARTGEFAGHVESSSPPLESWATYVVPGSYPSSTMYVDGEIVDIGEDHITEENLVVMNIAIAELLAGSDFTQLPDAPYTEEQKEEWREYRHNLRAISRHEDYPNVPLPQQPS